MSSYQLLLDSQSELIEEIEIAGASSHPKAKKIVKRLTKQLAEIETEILSKSKEIDLFKIAKALESTKKDNPAVVFKSLLVKNGIDYNCRLQIDFVFATGNTLVTVKPATIRTSKASSIERNTTEMPEALIVYLRDNKVPLTFAKTGEIESGTVFGSWENLFSTFISCYGELSKEYTVYNTEFSQDEGKKSRFESASAREKLSRLTKKVVEIDSFVTVKATGKTGTATESASAELENTESDSVK